MKYTESKKEGCVLIDATISMFVLYITCIILFSGELKQSDNDKAQIEVQNTAAELHEQNDILRRQMQNIVLREENERLRKKIKEHDSDKPLENSR